jgi:hypothetical protein
LKFGNLAFADLSSQPIPELCKIARSLRQALARERLRGLGRDYRYDLNRHIALKQIFDQVMCLPQMQNGAAAPSRKPHRWRRLSGPALTAETHSARQI